MSPRPSGSHEFVTIAFSHFCEKARWALDLAEVDYVEHGYMPLMHVFGVRLRGRPSKTSSRFSTPLLLHGDGRRWTSSTEIARYAAPHLFADPGAVEWDKRLEKFGAHTRRIVYFFTLPKPELLLMLAQRNVSRRQVHAFSVGARYGASFMQRALQVTEEGYRRSRESVDRMCDEVAETLQDGRPYLLGDTLSIADISFASLFAPCIGPARYGASLFEPHELPGPLRELIEAYREHPAGEFAMRIYDERPPVRAA